MTRLNWNAYNEQFLETGIDRGVLYPDASDGVPWDGLISVNSQPEGFFTESLYQDGVRTDVIEQPGIFAAAIEAYTYPDELDSLTKPFGMAYRTRVQHAHTEEYKIHLVYNAFASPADRLYRADESTTNIAWDLVTSPVPIPYSRPASHFVMDSRHTAPHILAEFESFIYGTKFTPPRLPSIEKLLTIFGQMGVLEIVDHGNGTFSAIGPDHMVQQVDTYRYRITAASAIPIDEYTFTVSSL